MLGAVLFETANFHTVLIVFEANDIIDKMPLFVTVPGAVVMS